MPLFEETHAGIISSIRKLQEQERANLSKMEELHKATPLTPANTEEIEKIKKVVEDNISIRENLYKTLKAMHTDKIKDSTDSSGSKAGEAMVGVVEKELSEMKNELEHLKVKKTNQNRLSHIQQFRKKKTEHIYQIMLFIMYCFLAILGVMVLRTLFLPTTIAQYAYIGIMSGCIIKVLWEIYDIAMRDNFYYDRYNWPVDKKKLKFDPNDAVNDDIGNSGGEQRCDR